MLAVAILCTNGRAVSWECRTIKVKVFCECFQLSLRLENQIEYMKLSFACRHQCGGDCVQCATDKDVGGCTGSFFSPHLGVYSKQPLKRGQHVCLERVLEGWELTSMSFFSVLPCVAEP